MGIPKTIRINDGNKGRITYYYWSDYDSYQEALYYAKRIKEERKMENMRLKHFILESQEGWFLPVPKFALYFSKKLRLI